MYEHLIETQSCLFSFVLHKVSSAHIRTVQCETRLCIPPPMAHLNEGRGTCKHTVSKSTDTRRDNCDLSVPICIPVLGCPGGPARQGTPQAAPPQAPGPLQGPCYSWPQPVPVPPPPTQHSCRSEFDDFHTMHISLLTSGQMISGPACRADNMVGHQLLHSERTGIAELEADNVRTNSLRINALLQTVRHCSYRSYSNYIAGSQHSPVVHLKHHLELHQASSLVLR